MHAVANAPLPVHDERTEAVLLYSEDMMNVQPDGKTKTIERRVYKILRPGGRGFGTVYANFDTETRITGIHGWCIPAAGKDYEVKDKDVLETALFGVENGELASDVRTKVLRIPASDPGNVVGYEIEHNGRPYLLEDEWVFQRSIPVRESHYTLQLPAGWEYKAVWVNHAEVAPTPAGPNQWQWVVNNVEAITPELDMPPQRGVAGSMIVAMLPPGGGSNRGFVTWSDMGSWETTLAQGRRDASNDIKQKVAALTGPAATPLANMRALAEFVQHDIRYVAIELGIGGWQPHAASEIFAHHYGDCKDKATLMSSMLKEIGVDSYYVTINTERGAAGPKTPPHIYWFNHQILAVKLPAGIEDSSVAAVMQHPKLGKLLFFDPTDELTPFGQLRGALQANYGLLVTPNGGELVELPQLPTQTNGLHRTALLRLSATGTLMGEVKETRVGDRAASQRYELRAANKDADRIKPIETMLGYSLSKYSLTKATYANLDQMDQPFEYNYSLVAESYAKVAGDLLLVRPRVMGSKATGVLEAKEPRRYPVEFEGPSKDTDIFEITLPPGFVVDDLPPAVKEDHGFASYQSKTEVVGNVLRYTRTFEVKDPFIPLEKVDELRNLYRIIAGDERNTAVLKPSASH
jgi:hypothetical protein